MHAFIFVICWGGSDCGANGGQGVRDPLSLYSERAARTRYGGSAPITHGDTIKATICSRA